MFVRLGIVPYEYGTMLLPDEVTILFLFDMINDYIFLVLFSIGLIAAIRDICRASILSKKVSVKRLYVENRVIFIAIYVYIILRCLSSITGVKIL